MIYLRNNGTDPHYNLAFEEYVFQNLCKDDSVLLLWQNDSRFLPDEWAALGVDLVTCGVMGLYQFIMYRFSLKRVMKIIL